jgi:hypothetical protein
MTLAEYKSNRHPPILLPILGCILVALGVGDAALKVWTGIDGTNPWRLSTGLVGGMGFALLIASFISATSKAVERLIYS